MRFGRLDIENETFNLKNRAFRGILEALNIFDD